MEGAICEHSILKDKQELQEKLSKYFRYTAHYIVVASAYMRPDQVRRLPCWGGRFVATEFLNGYSGKILTTCCKLSGGTQVDPGRIW